MPSYRKEFVEKRRWITDEELLDFTSVGRSTPGLMIGNAAILFGYHAAGVPGALAALLAGDAAGLKGILRKIRNRDCRENRYQI